jgi:hypothetical protein
VLDTSTSFGPASALTHAPMCTAIPPMSSPRTSHSSVCNPARSRGLPIGTVRTIDGTLVATVAQEVLLRSR